jgi:signal transduction histidine kinase
MEAPIKIDEKVVGKLIFDESELHALSGRDHSEVLERLSQLVATTLKNEELIAEIKAMDEVHSDFVSSFPHELRTPITIIKDSLSMLSQGELGELNEMQSKSLGLVTRNVDRLWCLSEELMEISRIALARAGIKRTLFDLNTVIREVLIAARSFAQTKGIRVTSSLVDEPVYIWADKDKVGVVLTSLVENAIKYNKDNGSVDVSLKVLSETVEISVKDSGPGINPEDVKRLFDKFYRIERSIRTKCGHWGVGLVVVNDIVQLHGGRVCVESGPEKGSLFIVSLPKDLRKRG